MRIFQAMLLNSSQRTIRWKYLQSLEEPKVVQIRVFQLDDASNMFAQATVRLFSQQVGLFEYVWHAIECRNPFLMYL